MPRAEDEQQRHQAGAAGDGQATRQSPSCAASWPASVNPASAIRSSDGDAQHAVHEHRRHGIAAADVKPGDAVRAHGIAADARQKAPQERADEKDAQDRRRAGDGPPDRGCRAARSSDRPSGRDRRARAGRRPRAAASRRPTPRRAPRAGCSSTGYTRSGRRATAMRAMRMAAASQGCGLGSVFTGRADRASRDTRA